MKAQDTAKLPHQSGCPAERSESYHLRRPRDGATIHVQRCVDCGAIEKREEGR